MSIHSVDAFFNQIDQAIDTFNTITLFGSIVRISGFMIEAMGLHVPIGAICRIYLEGDDRFVTAEVIGFASEITYLMSYDDMLGITPKAKIQFLQPMLQIPVGNLLLGRVVNGLCEAIDGKADIQSLQTYPLNAAPMNPIQRTRISQPLDVGVRAINTLLTVGRGQRMGIFAASGVGKSVLLGMITRFTEADVVVVGLIGERGREVKEFIEDNVGEAYLQKTVIVAAPVDSSPLMRSNGALVATTIAEHFRDEGKHVVLILDSLTRYGQALRQIYLSLGEFPSSKGFSPSVFSKISQLIERTGTGSAEQGSITAFYTVLTDNDDMNDPLAEHAKSILDGHVVLSRPLAEAGHYPAIDITRSISRVMPSVTQESHRLQAIRFKALWSLYQQNMDLIRMGMYQPGGDKKLDEAMHYIGKMTQFLQQGTKEQTHFHEELEVLLKLFEQAR